MQEAPRKAQPVRALILLIFLIVEHDPKHVSLSFSFYFRQQLHFPDIECTYDGARHSRPLLGGPRSHLEVRQDKVHDVLAKLS